MTMRTMPYPGDKAGPFMFLGYSVHEATGQLYLNCSAPDPIDGGRSVYHTLTQEAWIELKRQEVELAKSR